MVSLLFTWLISLAALVLVVWIAGAIYFDVGGASLTGVVLACVWIASAVAMLVLWRPHWMPLGTIAAVSVFFLLWWFSQKPSQHREWDANFTRLPRIAFAGDSIVIDGVRNTDYPAIGQSSPHFETRSYRLSELRGVDALFVSWGSPWMCHPMFVFDFGPGGRVCISIEVRYRVGQRFSLLRSLYRQQEIMYVVTDERDAILRRTKYLPGHDIYLYRLHAEQPVIRQFFLEYANSVNSLADEPRWYHGLTTNCTTSIYLQGRDWMQWDWRMLFNGALDRLLYDRQLLDQSAPFESLKRESWVNDIANAAPVKGFGEYIRRELPGYRQSPDRESREPIAQELGQT